MGLRDTLVMADRQILWGTEAALRYDTPGERSFAPEVLAPTVRVHTELSDGGRTVGFAIGTGLSPSRLKRPVWTSPVSSSPTR